MSRIGKLPISVPAGVAISVDKDNAVTVKGPKGSLTTQVDRDIAVAVEDGTLTVTRPTEQKRHKAMHGLYRSLINNMVEGVSKGFEKKLELVGVGYKASLVGSTLELALGYSHNVYIALPRRSNRYGRYRKRQEPDCYADQHRQSAAGPGGRQNSFAAQSRALQRQRCAFRG